MPVSKKQCRKLFSVIEDQLENMSKERVIESHFELFYELISFKAEMRSHRVKGATNKNAQSRELKKVFESVCTKRLITIKDEPKRLRFGDVSKDLARVHPEIEWLGTGMKPVEPNAKSQFKRSIRINKWLTEFNNKYFGSKEVISK